MLIKLKSKCPSFFNYRTFYSSSAALGKSSCLYEAAISKLNNLQSNAATIRKTESEGPISHVQQVAKIEATRKYLERIGISQTKLDSLSVIHISGTKGKGTTAALCESILRNYGYKTGLFTSPHLIEVRERIRINGAPLSHGVFSGFFEYCYNCLNDNKDHESDMPAYFKFLTVMAFHVFLQEQVDVAIVEVGIGGEYDCTNCIRTPAVVGIASLGLDHTSILGATLPDIAWQKSGIMKPGSIAFTVPQQSPAAMEVLVERAANRKCPLYVAPPLSSYIWEVPSPFARSIEDVYEKNTSLALQISNAWLKLQSPYGACEYENLSNLFRMAEGFHVPLKMVEGIKKCLWPGRTQILSFENITYFLDGAHTQESIEYCAKWFRMASNYLEIPTRRVLLFATTGQRDWLHFIELLLPSEFDLIILTTTTAFSETLVADQINVASSDDEESKRLLERQHLCKTAYPSIACEVMRTVKESLEFISKTNTGKDQVLITGSVRLVGSALTVLDPNLEQPVIRIFDDLRPLNNMYKDVQAFL